MHTHIHRGSLIIHLELLCQLNLNMQAQNLHDTKRREGAILKSNDYKESSRKYYILFHPLMFYNPQVATSKRQPRVEGCRTKDHHLLTILLFTTD